MAGIISNVDSDVQKLRKLKNEIENVKKALMGINIKVDIDIAKGLQSQLTSLLGQYDTLVDKIAAAEGKIMLSASRINKATEKIVKAQEVVSKPTADPAQNGDAARQTNTAETESVRAQAKAYDDLRTEINGILGTREENVKRMIDEMNAIRLINAEIKKINKSQGDYSSLSSAQQKRLEQLNNSLLTHKTALSEVRQALNNNAKLDNAAATSMNGLSQSLSRMRIAYRELTEEERNSPFGKELLTSINQADAKIKELDATIGNHQRNVGDYAKQWNGLQYQMQIVARELPNFAIDPQIGIISLTNNLPYLVDELKKAKDAHKAYIAEVKTGNKDLKAVPSVGKQIVSSLLNWNTAIIMGITLITAYRKEIKDWVAGLFKAKDALQDVASYQQNLSRIMSDSVKDSARERVELDTLYKATQNHTKSLKERNAAADELKKKYPSYFSNLTNEAILAGNAASAYKNLTDNILKASQARAAMKIIEENYNKIYQLQKAINADTNWTNRNRESTKGGTATTTVVVGSSVTGYTQSGQVLTKEAAEYNRRTDALRKNKEAVELLNKANEELVKSIDVTSLIENKTSSSPNKQDNQSDNQLKQQERLAEQLLSLRRKNQQDEINLLDEGTEKKLRQINLDYQKETDAIKKQRKEWEDAQGGKLTEEQTLVIDLRKELAGKKKDSDTSKVHEEEVKEYQKLLSSYQDYLTKRKNAEDKFNADRKKLKDGGASDAQINELEYQRDETLKSIDNEFAMREDSFKAWTDNIANLSLEKLRELLVQAERELERSEFLNLNDPKLAGQRAKVTSLKNIISEKASKTDTSPGKRSQKEWQDLYKTLSKVEKEFDEIGTTVGDTAGEIISAAGNIASSTLQMIDGITTLANSSSDAMAGTAQAASKSIQAVEKASVILAIVGAALQITMKMFDLFGGDNTTEKYEKTKETYESYINILDKVIDKQLELAESLSGDNANAAYEKAIELVKTQSDAARVLGKQYLNSGSSWKSHSKGYSEVDDMSWEGWNDAAKALGMSVDQFKSKMGGRMEGLFDLTDEQLEKLQAEAHIFWAQLDSDTQNYANQIAEGVAQVKEVLEQQMTDTTLIDVDTLRNDFHDLLTDMDADSADFADNFEDYMKNAILNSMLKESYMGRLEEWRKKFYAAMDDGVTEQEYNDLKEEGQQIADDMKAKREAMADMFGWKFESSSQEATAKGFQAMSQDTGEELNGRFTALQVAGEEIKNQNAIQVQSLNLLTMKSEDIFRVNTEIRNIADDTRDLIAQSYLELVQISENTGAIIKPIQQMQKDIAEVKKNTSKL
jgi:hypothetical protein